MLLLKEKGVTFFLYSRARVNHHPLGMDWEWTPNVPLEAQNVQNISPKYVEASSIFVREKDKLGQGQTRNKKRTGNAFVLPTITSTCTHNVEGCHHYLHKIPS
jgi:hypothetical protein